MAKCRERLPEFEYVVWDGDATTANRFLGEQYGVDWEYSSKTSPQVQVRPRSLGEPRFAEVGDVILKDISDNISVMKPLQFAMAYETIEGD